MNKYLVEYIDKYDSEREITVSANSFEEADEKAKQQLGNNFKKSWGTTNCTLVDAIAKRQKSLD